VILNLSALFLFLSGAASLIYQVSWARLLSLSIGSTSVSVSIVLATFFLGLALGSYLTSRIPAQRFTSLTPYLLLEALIGISAVLLLPVLLNLDQLITYWPPLGQLFIFKVLLVVMVLALPSICIGATYPLMVSLVVRESTSIGQRLGWLYSLNTAGAVCGAFAVGFVLIPQWGLDGAIYIACGLNFIVVGLGLLFKSSIKLPPLAADKNQPTHRDTSLSSLDKKVMSILFITGLCALASQVAWSKYLAIFVHTTIFGFSALLCITLLGIALGAWWMKRFVDRLTRPVHWLILLLCGLVLALILSRIGLQYLPTLYNVMSGSSDNNPLLKYTLIAFILLPPNLLFGALFTLNMRLFCGPLATLHQRAGRGYAINTLGGVMGALLAGLWLIPAYGSDHTLIFITMLIALTPLLFWAEIVNPHQQWLTASALTLMMLVLWLGPALDFRPIINASMYPFDGDKHAQRVPEYRFIEEGRSAVVSVTTYDGQRFRLQNNSLPEAVVTPPDPYPWLVETLLGLLPHLLHPAPKDQFIVGLGAGTTLSAAALSNAQSIRVVELEPAVERATQVIFKGGITALQDPRVNLVFDDARHHLLASAQNYDAIISQPSHPWLMGSGNLFTKEYFQLLSSHLKPGGISVQWLNLINMDNRTLQSIFQSYFNVFPYGMSFVIQHESSLLLIGAKQPLFLDIPHINQRLNNPKIQTALGKWEIQNFNDLTPYFGLSRADALAAAANSPENTDTSLIAEIRLSQLTPITQTEDPFELLLRYFSFDIAYYLKPEARAAALVKIANHLKQKGDQFRYTLLMQPRTPPTKEQ